MLTTPVLIANLIHKADDTIEDEGIAYRNLPVLSKTHGLCLAAFEVGMQVFEDRLKLPVVLALCALCYLIRHIPFRRHVLDVEDTHIT